jgi:hypothetical protein
MKITIAASIAVVLLSGAIGISQSQVPDDPSGVPLTKEAHHHLVFTNAEVRAFYVTIHQHDRTLIHRHDVDYVWIGLGSGKVVNTTVNGPVKHLDSKDAALHFTRGPLAHFASNEGETLYRNVTIELLKKQNNPHNLCEQVIEGKPAACVPATAGLVAMRGDGSVKAQFETDEIRFNLVTIGHGAEATVRGSKNSPVIVALADTNAAATQKGVAQASELKDGSVMAAEPGDAVTLKNTGTGNARFLVLEFKD